MANTVTIALTLDEFNMVMQARAKELASQLSAAAGSDTAASWKAIADNLGNLGAALTPVAQAVASTASAAAAAEKSN